MILILVEVRQAVNLTLSQVDLKKKKETLHVLMNPIFQWTTVIDAYMRHTRCAELAICDRLKRGHASHWRGKERRNLCTQSKD